MRRFTVTSVALLCLQGASCLFSPGYDHSGLADAGARRRDSSPFLDSTIDEDLARLDRRQESGRCGPDFGNQVCPGQECCSMYGWCGDSAEYCNAFGCQADFGWCEGEPIPTTPPTTTSVSTPPAPPPPASTSAPSSQPSPPSPPASTGVSPVPGGELTISTNGMCGNGTTCAGSGYGRCCSYYYYCGNTDDYCGDHCRNEFGSCGSAPPTPPQTDLIISEDGRCGNGSTCAGSQFGSCCSDYYWCGAGVEFCGDKCRSAFGLCGESPPSQPSQPSIPISTNGMCGNGTTCAGSQFGNCCSFYYWCGNGADYCEDNCRSQFGSCN